jgi:methylenetetrahydrofolate dehydrogenase (NADP+)/methenyltetrahydrofolate cyclohydrolase
VSADNYQLIDGKKISEIIIQEIAEETKLWIAKNHRAPHLAAILVGNDGASETYVASKIKMCEKVGFKSSLVRCTTTITEKQLLGKIEKLNNDDSVDGFIIQLPLPRHISELKVIEAIHLLNTQMYHHLLQLISAFYYLPNTKCLKQE